MKELLQSWLPRSLEEQIRFLMWLIVVTLVLGGGWIWHEAMNSLSGSLCGCAGGDLAE